MSAIIVTRGDHNYAPSLGNWPLDWQRIVWDNGAGICRVWNPDSQPFDLAEHPVSDLAVYGRYAAIEYASHDTIYVQDDDVIVSDPQAIVAPLIENYGEVVSSPFGFSGEPTHVQIKTNAVVCNMPPEFRHEGYTDSCLVGFGAAFHRDAPRRAFGTLHSTAFDVPDEVFNRTCDVVFTTLTPRVLVDVPKVDREFASADERMWKQAGHYGERVRMLELARRVRDAQ